MRLSFDTHLSAAVVTLIALETLLVLVGLLVLDERVSLVEHGITVAALLSRLDERMLFPQVDACDRQEGSATVHWGCEKPTCRGLHAHRYAKHKWLDLERFLSTVTLCQDSH